MNALYQKLLELKETSEKVQGLLLQEDMDLVMDKLYERQKLLDGVQELLTASDISNEKRMSSEIESLIKSILSLDQNNMKEVNARLSELSNSLSYLGREKQTLKRLKSETRVRRKRIVDILY